MAGGLFPWETWIVIEHPEGREPRHETRIGVRWLTRRSAERCIRQMVSSDPRLRPDEWVWYEVRRR